MEWIFIGLGLGLIWVAIKAVASNAAKGAYSAALSELTADPTNPALRKKTLELGRVYSNAMRNNKGVTTFDEVALLNDINAACGVGTPTRGTTDLSLQERFNRLEELKAQGLITDHEYQEKRNQLVAEA